MSRVLRFRICWSSGQEWYMKKVSTFMWKRMLPYTVIVYAYYQKKSTALLWLGCVCEPKAILAQMLWYTTSWYMHLGKHVRRTSLGRVLCQYTPWIMLQYFWPALSDNRSWKPIFGLFESGRFRQGFFSVENWWYRDSKPFSTKRNCDPVKKKTVNIFEMYFLCCTIEISILYHQYSHHLLYSEPL